MSTRLRLHADPHAEKLCPPPKPFRFPSTEAERSRLRTGSTLADTHARDTAPDGGDPDVAGRVFSSPELVAEIERTLAHMQDRLGVFKHDLNDALKFPTRESTTPRPSGPMPPSAA